ncbi:MAG: PQQ-binding-like beta-propeller repeat protein [Candidatus Heimdallarchaeota archaeon]|nr:PQQ-binding-like beta-propeller repeat protein [Candidatus Heimdallarchaeota archaeon]
MKSNKISFILITLLMLTSGMYNSMAETITEEVRGELNDFTIDSFENGIPDPVEDDAINNPYDSLTNMNDYLADAANDYNIKWDPWVSKAAIHAVATTDDAEMMALAGGYLYDNEIHLYRWNYVTSAYDLVWEIGGGIFQSDVTSLVFADTDYNNLIEVIAGSEDGGLYVFEQTHIYDPYTNMENQFDLVWSATRIGRIMDLIIGDLDGDFKQDIIVGAAKSLKVFEFDEHGRYPYSSDHWMSFNEVFSYQVPSDITAVGITDVNQNTLKEIAVGMRSGEILLLENNGTIIETDTGIMPFPQDNSYDFYWSSGTMINRAISSMDGGDLDNDGLDELLLTAQGDGVYILDTIEDVLGVHKITKPFEDWEVNDAHPYPLDHYVDLLSDTSSRSQESGSNPGVYFDTFSKDEPGFYGLELPTGDHYNTRVAGVPDGYYTTIAHNYTDNQYAIFDFGQDEEVSGNGVPNLWDLKIRSFNTINTNVFFDISVDNINWYPLYIDYNNYQWVYSSFADYYVEIDPTLADFGLDYFRYLKISVVGTNAMVKIDSIYTRTVNTPIDTAQSSAIGEMTFKGSNEPVGVGFVGTVDGSIIAIAYNETSSLYEVVWDSWVDERYKLDTNLFDLALTKAVNRFPAWIDYGAGRGRLGSDVPFGNGEMFSYTAENFVDFNVENNLEYIVTTTNGWAGAYRQYSEYANPVFDAELTSMLFNVSDSIFADSVNGFMKKKRDAGAQYFSFSFFPIETTYVKEQLPTNLATNPLYPKIIDPLNNAYWLIISSWDGEISNGKGGYNRELAANDVAIYYQVNVKPGSAWRPSACSDYVTTTESCTYFTPLFMEDEEGYSIQRSLQDLELTGTLSSVLLESTWSPQFKSMDTSGSEYADLIMSNGKLHLLETTFAHDDDQGEFIEIDTSGIDVLPEQSLDLDFELVENVQSVTISSVSIATATQTQHSRMEYTYRGDYFKTINENSGGRAWTYANPVDFDDDGDMDLIVGYARYDSDHFGFDEERYGITYWQNDGSREYPIWVEIPYAVNNADPLSGMATAKFNDPTVIYNNYVIDPTEGLSFLGYHPLMKSKLPSSMLVFQTLGDQSIFNGRVVNLFADYEPSTSLLAASYPSAKRIDINLKFSVYPNSQYYMINYGYHIMETWDNEDELQDWTLSMSTADLDNDGKNEIIVGDFNNNIYVFEHLTNNTFKRAYKSFDINDTIKTNISPYLNEEFDGIGASFNRTIFNHVTQINAGFDLNQNGLQEFVASTDDNIYVFEAVYTTVGSIQDDTYRLISVIEINEHPFLKQLPSEKRQITALTTGDINGNGKLELIVVASSAMLIYEIEIDTSNYEEANYPIDVYFSHVFQYSEIFLGNSGKGKYNLPGNIVVNQHFLINDVHIADLDQNGRQDLIIAGEDLSTPLEIRSGFVVVLKWDGIGFVKMYDFDSFTQTTEYTPVYDVEVDNADFDNSIELIISHKYGIDIYENVAGSQSIAFSGSLTSDASRSFETSKYLYLQHISGPDHDILRTSAGGLVMAFSQDKYLDLIQIYSSTDNGGSWSAVGSVEASGVTISFEQFSLLEKDSKFYLSYVERDHQFSIDYLTIKVLDFTISGGISTIREIVDFDFQNRVRAGQPSNLVPNLINMDIGADLVGIIYQSDLFGSATNPNFLVRASIYDHSTGEVALVTYNATAFGSLSPVSLRVNSMDVFQSAANSYDIVLSGYYLDGNYLDLDLYYSTLVFDMDSFGNIDYSPYNATWGPVKKLFTSGLSSYNPEIIREPETNNIIVTFEQSTTTPYGGIFAMSSKDDGVSWSEYHSLIDPLGFDDDSIVLYNDANSDGYRSMTQLGNAFLQKYEAMRPAIVPNTDIGFTLNYYVNYEFSNYSNWDACDFNVNPRIGKRDFVKKVVNEYPDACGFNMPNAFVTVNNPQSDFTRFTHGSITKMAVGDSDKDGRHEILGIDGRNAYLFEYLSNTVDHIRYTEKWISPTYVRDLTDVEISDANGNGYPELILESDRGVINTYEVINKEYPGAPEIFYSSVSGFAEFSDGTIHYNAEIKEMIPLHLNEDEFTDILAYSPRGYIAALDVYNDEVLYGIKIDPANSDFNVEAELHLLRIDGEVSRFVYEYYSFILVYNLYTGVLIGNYSTSGYDPNGDNLDKSIVGDFTTGDLDNDGTDEIIVGYMDGTIKILDTEAIENNSFNNFNPEVPKSNIAYVTNIVVGEFTSTSVPSIAISSKSGWSAVFTNTGTVVWKELFDFYTIDIFGTSWLGNKMVTTDLNSDGLLDIVVGASNLTAINGATGELLWSTILTDGYFDDIQAGAATKAPIVEDINDDDIDDIIHTLYTFSSKPGPKVIAIDGATGEIIWNFQNPEGATANVNLGISAVITPWGDEILMAYGHNIREAGNYFGVTMIDMKTGKGLGFVSVGAQARSVLQMEIKEGEPTILVGGSSGWINQIDLYRSLQPISPDPITQGLADPFIRVGEEFSSRTKFFAEDVFANDAIGTDGVDDIFVVDDYYFGGADTYLLRTDESYNKAIWDIYDRDFGLLYDAQKGDFDGDGKNDLIIAYESGIYVINMADGQVIEDYKYPGDPKGWDSFEFELLDWISGGGVEIVYSLNKYVYDIRPVYSGRGMRYLKTLVSNVEVGVFSIEDSQYPIYSAVLNDVKDAKFDMADFNEDGLFDLVIAAESKTNPGNYKLNLFSNTMAVLYEIPSTTNNGYMTLGLLGDILAGQLDTNPTTNEFLLILDSPTGENSIFYKLSFNGTGLVVPSVDAGGVATIPGNTLQAYLSDIDGDSVQDLMVETTSGDIYGAYFGQSEFVFTTLPQIGYVDFAFDKEVIVAPNARSRYLENYNGFYDSCKFAAVAAHNTIACYPETKDFLDNIEPTWSVPIDFDAIADIIIADLDEGGVPDDLLLISQNGYVWIVDQNSFNSPLSLSGNVDSVQNLPENSIEITSIIMISSLGAILFVTTMWYIKNKNH